MALANGKEMGEILIDAIRTHLQKEIGLEFEEKKKVFIEEIDRRKDEIVAATLINVMKSVDFQHMQDRIVFTVRKVEAKP